MSDLKPSEAGAAVKPRPRVRDRIFETACELFYQQGIRAVGVDTIATEAGTNKMSFYRSFASKDELVAAYLREQVRDFLKTWDEVCALHPEDARQQIIDLFTHFRTKNCSADQRGCALGNAAVEIRDDSHPARPVIVEYKSELRRRWRELARRAGARDADQLGDCLLMLQDGGYQSKLTFCGYEGPLQHIVHAAEALIDCSLKD